MLKLPQTTKCNLRDVVAFKSLRNIAGKGDKLIKDLFYNVFKSLSHTITAFKFPVEKTF